jgi:hypothetical protein
MDLELRPRDITMHCELDLLVIVLRICKYGKAFIMQGYIKSDVGFR